MLTQCNKLSIQNCNISNEKNPFFTGFFISTLILRVDMKIDQIDALKHRFRSIFSIEMIIFWSKSIKKWTVLGSVYALWAIINEFFLIFFAKKWKKMRLWSKKSWIESLKTRFAGFSSDFHDFLKASFKISLILAQKPILDGFFAHFCSFFSKNEQKKQNQADFNDFC